MTRVGIAVGFPLLLAITVWLYAPGVAGSFTLDDAINLRDLAALEEGTAFIDDVAWGNRAGPMGRPVSMLTFAASYLAAGYGDPHVFKAHNLAIHLLCGALVFWLALLLGRARDVRDFTGWALLACALWLLAPLQLSTVLYVVQRMAQLATLFVLAALVCFCKARMQPLVTGAAAWLLLLASATFLLLAALSKESGLVGLPLVLLTEHVMFRPGTPSPAYRTAERATVVMLLLCAAGFTALAVSGRFASTLLDYGRRDFNLAERVLTQSRVLWDYLAGFVWPFRSGYGLLHDDFSISNGLADPPQTLIAILALVCTMVALGWLLARRKAQLLAYGVIFFFVGHSLESTIFPLEIYFEHRNYLPSAGLAIAMAFAVQGVRQRVAELRALAFVVLTALVIGSALNTGLLAVYWSADGLRTLRDVAEHPLSVRANLAMAMLHAKAGSMERALEYASVAHELEQPVTLVRLLRSAAFHCASGRAIPHEELAAVPAALWGFGDASVDEAFEVVVDQALRGKCDNQSLAALADILWAHRTGQGYVTPRAMALSAKLENHLQRYDRALGWASDFVARSPDQAMGHLMLLYFSMQTGDEPRIRQARARIAQLHCERRLTLQQVSTYELLAGTRANSGQAACQDQQLHAEQTERHETR